VVRKGNTEHTVHAVGNQHSNQRETA